ncbi:MAG: hypothetical protein HY696_13010 [Deltaproteobacteria bacterium]|nr:hypothetical protein [Deltaproteobacteria bacterium]
MGLSGEQLWQERLRILRALYAVGIHILSERIPPSDPRISPQWEELDQHWQAFLALDPLLQDAPPPEDVTLRHALLQQANQNAAVYKALVDHAQQLQDEVGDLLLKLRGTSDTSAAGHTAVPAHIQFEA